jgi:hypothetical protein
MQFPYNQRTTADLLQWILRCGIPLYAQHVRWKPDVNGVFRTILTTRSAVPALLRIFHVGSTNIPGGFHVNGIDRADGIAQTASGTFIHVENRRHFLSSRCSSTESEKRRWGEPGKNDIPVSPYLRLSVSHNQLLEFSSQMISLERCSVPARSGSCDAFCYLFVLLKYQKLHDIRNLS